MRRLFPFLLTLGFALIGLGWGWTSLNRIFTHEREDALDGLRTERRALEQYAALLLRQSLHQAMDEHGTAQSALRPASPMVLDGHWYLEPQANGKVRVVPVDLTALATAVGAEMKQRRLLDASGRVTPGRIEPHMPAELLRPSVEMPRWRQATQDIDARHRLKSLLLLLSAGLVLLALLLIRFTQWRKQSYLELKSSFVATVSHELRTPLASIRLLGETLAMRVAALPEARDYPARIVAEADGLSFLVENILSFNRLDKNGWRLKRSRVSLEEICSLLEAPELELQSNGLTLDADPVLLQLVFSNLLRNARAYTVRSPRIQVTVPRPGEATVLFRDNGVGIPRAEWERVFDEFHRLPGHEEIRGSGLGLTLCRRILRLHGGELRVVESSDQGTTFELSFPRSRT